jgi:hypothetical protein
MAGEQIFSNVEGWPIDTEEASRGTPEAERLDAQL